MSSHRFAESCLVAIAAFTWNAHAADTAPVVPPKTKALAQAPVSAASTKDALRAITPALSPWHLSVGFIYRNLGELRFSTQARSRGFAIPAADMSNTGRGGSATGFGGHDYDDGFVKSDVSGPNSPDTWFWGYQSASQLNGNDLSFHGTATVFNQSITAMDHPGWNSDMAGGGPILSARWDGIEIKPGLRVGADLSLSLVTADEGRDFNTLRVEQQALNASITDHYTVDPLAIPAAPFVGTFAGPGSIIPSSPSSRDVNSLGKATDANTTTFFDEVREKLDLTVTTLSFGPTVSYEHKRITATAGLGLAINVAAWDADKTDILYRRRDGHTSTLARWHDHESGTDILPGFYLQATIAYAIDDQWSIQAFGRYDWSEALEGRVGGSSFSLDLSGWSVGAGVVYRF